MNASTCFNGAAVFQLRKRRSSGDSAGGRFNGAAVFQLRKRASLARRAGELTGFNGAAVFQLRKRGSRGRQATGGFNGAAVFQLRKRRDAMSDERLPLQWGRSLSTAETAGGVNGCSAKLRLQWGRSLSTAETAIGGPQPRPCRCCFNGAAVFQLRKPIGRHTALVGATASMGPQSFNCGNDGDAGLRGDRSFNGAAVFQLRKPLEPMGRPQWRQVLQWGRSLSTAETVHRAPRGEAFLASMGPQSFNCGNADPLKATRAMKCSTGLQWGRSLSTAETIRSPVF